MIELLALCILALAVAGAFTLYRTGKKMTALDDKISKVSTHVDAILAELAPVPGLVQALRDELMKGSVPQAALDALDALDTKLSNVDAIAAKIASPAPPAPPAPTP